MGNLKPLEWVVWCDGFEARTPFGAYHVEPSSGGRWKWRYCFDEYYDEDELECFTCEDGKEFAWKHWLDRMSSMVVDP